MKYKLCCGKENYYSVICESDDFEQLTGRILSITDGTNEYRKEELFVIVCKFNVIYRLI